MGDWAWSRHVIHFKFQGPPIISQENLKLQSDTVNMFKSRLDKFWQHQDLIYDFKAEITGTGSRSCY